MNGFFTAVATALTVAHVVLVLFTHGVNPHGNLGHGWTVHFVPTTTPVTTLVAPVAPPVAVVVG